MDLKPNSIILKIECDLNLFLYAVSFSKQNLYIC